MDVENIVSFLSSMGEHDMATEVATMANRLEAFASGLDRDCVETARLAEREACAELCDRAKDIAPTEHARMTAEICADTIRMRSNDQGQRP